MIVGDGEIDDSNDSRGWGNCSLIDMPQVMALLSSLAIQLDHWGVRC